jgi:penicillin-binding protein 1A
MGYSPNLVCGVFVGFDQPRTLGPNEQGATVAVPIFRDFMTEALSEQPSVPFAVPPGIRLVRVNHDTGRPAKPGDTNVILEAFRTDMKVSRPDRSVLDGSSEVVQSETSRRSSTGGIY